MQSTTDKGIARERAFNQSFNNWLSEPMTRMGLSMIPTGDRDDILKTVVRSAFDAGTSAGACYIIQDLLLSTLKKEKGIDQC